MSNGNGSKGNGSDIQQALNTLRRQLASLPAKQRLEALIESRDARALVRSLPAEDLYFSIMEVGLADATEIVQLASPEQFLAFVDLGGWKKDQVDLHQVLTWLRAARGDEAEDFLRKLRKVDTEIFELLVREFTLIHDLEENPDVHVEGVTLETPEGRYLVEFKGVEGPELAAMRSILTDIIAENPFEAVRFLEATRWEVPGELEESAYRFRSGRLQDLGFPALEEAARLFSRVDTGPTPAPAAVAALVATKAQPDYLDAAFRALEDVERENLEGELRYLANATLVAEVEDPGDLDAIRRVGEMVRDYLLLGLEHLTGGDPSKAARVVRDTETRRVFQVGFSLTLALKFRADRLMKQPLAQVEGTPLLFTEEAAAVEALRRKRPRRTLKVPGAEPVSFRSRRELAASEEVLTRAEAQVALLGALLGGTEKKAREVLALFGVEPRILGVERFFAAAVALALLEGKVGPRPVPSARRDELGALLFEGTAEAPRLRPDVAARAVAVLEPAVPESARPELRRLVNATLARLLEELGPSFLQEGRLNPIASVLLPIEGGEP
ncbi:hypothetical protein ATI61_10291 [Archangium gephyra]|uniref:Uncharacterized protein n=1 Tax=Archangium gephyra TaxID=48 RepID=A0AAC8QCA4_9BACT|nr:DUF6178 family protein [Archangium gephyra]AKJ05020.1 Hypothetical protein AA314_06646 [Archangium gephyra]REG35723.1 hypothetical protein ATI61_10291 [Archangium gephyra]